VKSLNPFNGPGSPQAEQRRIRRERFHFVVWTIVVANVLLLMGLLIQGCQREPAEGGTAGGNGAEMASSDTNGVIMGQPTPDANALVTPTFEAPTPNAFAESAATNAAPNPVQEGARQYRVVKGDSFYKIARANGVSMQAVMDANPGVDSAKLKVGQELQIPAGAQAAIAAPAKAPAHASATVGTSRSTYVVKSGDTLGRIAKAHGTTVKAIKAANGLTNDRLAVGRSLKMPQSKAARAGTSQV
jgi:LysM repeat protein